MVGIENTIVVIFFPMAAPCMELFFTTQGWTGKIGRGKHVRGPIAGRAEKREFGRHNT